MREKPILFSAPMVQAILEGRKTMTRRVIKQFPVTDYRWGGYIVSSLKKQDVGKAAVVPESNHVYCATGQIKVRPPYRVGDVLWVRETWSPFGGNYLYQADGENYYDPCVSLSGGYPASCRNHSGCEGCRPVPELIKWKPSIHMPRKACRLFLKVTGVGVERLRDITEDDARKEGVTAEGIEPGELFFNFISLWDSLYKSRGHGWEENPFVWVIEFEKLEDYK